MIYVLCKYIYLICIHIGNHLRNNQYQHLVTNNMSSIYQNSKISSFYDNNYCYCYVFSQKYLNMSCILLKEDILILNPTFFFLHIHFLLIYGYVFSCTKAELSQDFCVIFDCNMCYNLPQWRLLTCGDALMLNVAMILCKPNDSFIFI